MTRWILAVLGACVLLSGPAQASAEAECVVLLHGLFRVSNSMGELETKLQRAGFVAVNIDYPSRSFDVEILARDAVGRGLEACRASGAKVINFVTHSLGSILLRYYVQYFGIAELGRVVMLGPPNHGSELVDGLSPVPGFTFLTGPAGAVLGTGESSILNILGPVDFDLGVIAGTRNINPLNWIFIPEPNDSIVSVSSTKIAGMHAHVLLPVTHSLMMRNNTVIDHTIHYLKTGEFMP